MKTTVHWLPLPPPLAFQASGAAIPEFALPAGVGVNIHFMRGHAQDLDMIAAAGFKWIRMDFAWGGTERKRGEYDWSAYDELTANLEKRGLRALYILDYSNSLYEETVSSKNPITGEEHKDTASPQHPESVAAFAKWAGAGAQHFRGRPIIWEIWNEPNISFWKPRPDVKQYIPLALATCQAIREADPKATMTAPATSGIPFEFLEEFFKSGVLAQLDAVSVHPYRNYSKSPETAAADYQKLRALIDRYAPPGKKLPILSGEWGYASHTKGVSLETQAAFIVRQQLSNLLNGVPLSIWYDWKNDGPDANEREHNFGTVTLDLKPKPAYLAVQTMTRELTGYRVLRRVEVGSEKDFVLVFNNSSKSQKLVAWSLAEAHTVKGELSGRQPKQLSAVRNTGETFTATVEGKSLILDLAGDPTYVTLGKGAVNRR